MKARPATPDDKPAILLLLDLMHAEIGQFPINRAKVEQTVDDLFESGRIAVIEEDENVIGTIGLYAWECWYSDQALLSDQWVYIAEEHRTWPAFNSLITIATELAEQAGMPFLLSLYTLKDTERKEFLFQRFADQLVRGYQFTPVGGTFKKEP